MCGRATPWTRWPSALSPVFGTGGVPPILPAVDGSHATSVQRGLNRSHQTAPDSGAITLGRISIDSSRHTTRNPTRPVRCCSQPSRSSGRLVLIRSRRRGSTDTRGTPSDSSRIGSRIWSERIPRPQNRGALAVDLQRHTPFAVQCFPETPIPPEFQPIPQLRVGAPLISLAKPPQSVSDCRARSSAAGLSCALCLRHAQGFL